MRRATRLFFIIFDLFRFLSTLSLRRATDYVRYCIHGREISIHALDLLGWLRVLISIHALLAESDWLRCWQLAARDISIHALLAESDLWVLMGGLNCNDFYPRSPCGERLTLICDVIAEITISIHALLAESDPVWILRVTSKTHFYPRSPCGERPLSKTIPRGGHNFYPRSPCGERRSQQPEGTTRTTYFYPRSPCGERLSSASDSLSDTSISIHALLAESDGTLSTRIIGFLGFLSTLSLRRATAQSSSYSEYLAISIHALLAESDEGAAVGH